MRTRLPACVVAVIALATVAPAAHAASLRAGVGRADITPPTGYYMMGWVRSDARVTGQHTRLFARVVVLEQGGRKFALVSEDLNAIPGGMLAQAADMVRDRGYSAQNVLDSASHTHAAPTGFYNFGTYNTVFMSANSLTSFNLTGQLDPQLYTFMVRRLALAIRRADDDLGPAAVGWGATQIFGLTQNRSLEAHLADRGVFVDYGQGTVAMDPLGYADTIDPDVNVLRVDRVVGRRRVPIGIWSTFADHGTVNKYTFHYYNEDHHGAATRVVEGALRREAQRQLRGQRARLRGQDFVNAYGNTDEGDISAGLTRSGPADAEYVGDVEAHAMLDAWRSAGRRMTRHPVLDSRWTRICFCGQSVDGGQVDSRPVVGAPLFTGSEEGRGPLYDVTHVPFEGDHLPVDTGPQGDKIGGPSDFGGSLPHAVPLTALRIGDRMIVSVPGEMTEEMGRRVRASVLKASAGAGIHAAVISGLANEYLQYFTTPEEYERQHYEGGSTLYGKLSSVLIQNELTALAQRLATGQPAPTAYPYDPTNKISATAAAFSPGAASGRATAQPGRTARLDRATFSWQGGPKGTDRPLDTAFVTVQRRTPRGWRRVMDDLGLQILWTVDENGGYQALWEVPLGAPAGTYRFVVTANRYRLESLPFAVVASGALKLATVQRPGVYGVELQYPAAVPERDLTYRPSLASGGTVVFDVAGRRVVKTSRSATLFSVAVPAHGTVSVRSARDRYGNAAH